MKIFTEEFEDRLVSIIGTSIVLSIALIIIGLIGWLEVETLDEDTDRVQFSAKINYCPMCGRKLSDK